MLIVTFQFSFKVTTDRSRVFVKYFNRSYSETGHIPLILVWEYFEAHDYYLNNFRRPLVGSTFQIS